MWPLVLSARFIRQCLRLIPRTVCAFERCSAHEQNAELQRETRKRNSVKVL
jgi:hypothetical protein